MLNHERDPVPRPASAEPSTDSTDTTSFANKVAAEYDELEAGHLIGLYRFFGRALTSYRKYRNDSAAHEELLELDYIASLREKPGVKETSRSVIYKLTTARTGAKRNAAGRYARVVDYLFQQGIKSGDVAKYVENAGGMDAILKLARGHEAHNAAKKSADNAQQRDDPYGEQGEETDEEAGSSSASGRQTDDIFDIDKDLAIRATDDARARVLGPDIPFDVPFYFKCKKTRLLDGGGIRIVGSLVDRPSE